MKYPFWGIWDNSIGQCTKVTDRGKNAPEKGTNGSVQTEPTGSSALGYNEILNKSFQRSNIRVPQRTLSIIKPDAVRNGVAGAILAEIDKAGFRIVAIKKDFVSKRAAAGFYAVHRERPFFDDLTTFMSSGPIILMVLEKENAIAGLRKLMGATNPANAEEGTIRKKFASSIQENAIHGSDAEDTAAFEIGYWFAGCELI